MVEEKKPLRESLPGIELLPGVPTIDLVGGPVCRHLTRNGDLSWAALGEMTPHDILGLSHMGQKRLDSLVGAVTSLLGTSVLVSPAPTESTGGLTPAAVAALREVAAWAVSKGHSADLATALTAAAVDTDLDAPRRAIDALRNVQLSDLADPDAVRRYDPVVNAHDFIDSFDPREQDALERILDLDRSAPTLEEIGERWGVTRERIRQIESRVRSRLGALSTSADHLSLMAAAAQLADRLGAAIPLREVKRDFAEFPPDLVDRLLLHLAGPYRISDEWVVGPAVTDTVDAAVVETFDRLSESGLVSYDGMADALVEAGLRSEHVDDAIASTDRLRRMDDTLVDWRGSLGQKAVRVLELRGEPMTKDELVAAVEPTQERSLLNVLPTTPEIRRVGLGRFALVEWGGEEYQGIVSGMIQRLAATGPTDVDVLADDLSREFGASPNSVKIYAGTHPAFVVDSGLVRLRTSDQPYEPSQRLEQTCRVYRNDSGWIWRYQVDKDVLRGSGRSVPESVAVLLGARPGDRHVVRTDHGDLTIRWFHLPTISSTRAIVRALEAEAGDWMVLRWAPGAGVTFDVIRSADLPSDAKGRLGVLIGLGQSPSDSQIRDALGLPADASDDAVRAHLRSRREPDLVDLIDGVASVDG